MEPDLLFKEIISFLKEHDDVESVSVVDADEDAREGLIGVETVNGETYFVEVKLT